MGERNALLADSTFYICLLDDIRRPDILTIVAGSFRLVVTGLIMREITRKRDMGGLADMLEIADRRYDTGGTLRPLLGEGQKTRGEHEVIALAHIMHTRGRPFTLVVDDAGGRKFARRHFAHLAGSMTGTVGFVAQCHTRHSILARDEALEVLEAIRASGFRAPDEAIDAAAREVTRN